MISKEQQDLLNTIARRDGAYIEEPTERGMVYRAMNGDEIVRDETSESTEIELLKARIEQQEARLAVLEARR